MKMQSIKEFTKRFWPAMKWKVIFISGLLFIPSSRHSMREGSLGLTRAARSSLPA